MDYFENTTRITEEGFAAILKMKRRKKRRICRLCSILLAIPFLQRLIYLILLVHIKGGSLLELHFQDVLFLILLLLGAFLWHYPKMELQTALHDGANRSTFQTVNHYSFLSDGIHMMTTASMEKFLLSYQDIAWIRSDRRWIVIRFESQDFTMLVDKQGFTKGDAAGCLAMLYHKTEE